MVLGWQGIYFSTLSHIAYESQLIVASSLRGKKNLQKSQVHAWCLFDIHDICLIPLKKYLTNFFPLRFFQPFFRRHPIHPKKNFAGDAPPFEIQAFDAPRDTWQQMGWVGWVVGRPCWHPASRTGLEGHFSGANFAVKLSKRVKTRGFCLRGTFFSSPWNYLKKKVLQRNWFVNFFGCWLHTPNCIVMWWTKRFLIFLASNYLQRPPTQWWLTLLLRLHTSDVGVHVLPHLPSREALRCPPWHLRCFVHKEKLVTKRAET